MGNYNPNNPETAGIEWAPTRLEQVPVGPAYSSAPAQLVTATSTQTVDKIKAYMTPGGHFGSDTGNTGYQIDVYEADDFDAHSTLLHAVSAPVADDSTHTSSSWTRSDNGLTTNRFQLVDEHPSAFTAPTTAWGASVDGLRARYPQTSTFTPGNPKVGTIGFRFSTSFTDRFTAGAVSLTGKRIVDVQVAAYFATIQLIGYNYVFGYLAKDTVQEIPLVDHNTGTWYPCPGDGKTRVCVSSSFGSPQGLAPFWKESDLTPFLSGGAGAGVIRADYLNSQGFALYNVWLEVLYATEKRLATGYVTVPKSTSPTWVSFDMRNPLTGATASWTKTSGQEYMIVIRPYVPAPGKHVSGDTWHRFDQAATDGLITEPLTGQASKTVPFINPTDTVGKRNVTQRAGFLPPATYVDTFPETAGSHAFYMLSGSTVRADSQPYGEIAEVELTSGVTVEQEIANTASAQYGLARVLLLNDTDAHATDDDLTVQLRRRSDSALLASGTITVDDLPDTVDNIWYPVVVLLDTFPTLVAATQYYVRLSTSATEGAWTVNRLSTIVAEGAADGFGGTTNAATIDAVETSHYDLALGISRVPSTLTGLSSEVGEYDVDRNMSGRCIVSTVSHAYLQWTVSSLGADFLKYEIQRNDDAVWRTIAEIFSADPAVFVDFECRRNVLCGWRVRQWRTDNVPSDWASFGDLTITADDYVVVLASNTEPGASLGFHEEPGLHYERLARGRMVEQALYGRDKMLAFTESENRGERFTRRLIFAFDDGAVTLDPKLGGRAMFDPLIALIEDPDLPNIALLDHRGRRWYTAPAAVDLSHEEPRGRYIAEVSFLEVAGPTPASLAVGIPIPPPVSEGGEFYGSTYGSDY